MVAPRQCGVCGQPFFPGRKKYKFCSEPCRVRRAAQYANKYHVGVIEEAERRRKDRIARDSYIREVARKNPELNIELLMERFGESKAVISHALQGGKQNGTRNV